MGRGDYYDGFPPYVSVAEKKAIAAKSAEKMRKKNPGINPVVIQGTKIAKTWWGSAWIKNLESYADYSNRLGRGRSYVRHGAVLDLQINKGIITALVQGSRTKPYSVDIKITSLPQAAWENIVSSCGGTLGSLSELLAGKFPKSLSEIFMEKGKGLFPSPQQISFNCSCPDWASMCKHVAAVLYGIGSRLDDDPSLFFILRGVNTDDLISKAVAGKTESLLAKPGRKGRRVMDDSDISAVFGIEIDNGKKKGKATGAVKKKE